MLSFKQFIDFGEMYIREGDGRKSCSGVASALAV